ncbi:MAG: histidine kinase [Gallionella sp.]|nr:histidine kinase [Gallionella sp.]
MNKPMEWMDKPDKTAFFWKRDPEFALPCKGGGADCGAPQEPRPGDLNALLNMYLDTALGCIHASACVVRVLLPDEQTLQVISAVGLTGEELEAERIVELACEECGKDSFRLGLCVADAKSCETRHGSQPHRQFRSVISIPLKSRKSPEILLGVFTLFFDTPQSSSGIAANMAVSFAELLSGLLEHIKASRETKRAELLMERQTIANEIHDSLAQTLNYARMNTTLLSDAVRNDNGAMAAKYALDIDEALEISQKAVRALITDFRSEMDPAGLLHALQTLAGQFRRQHAIELDCMIRIADLDLPLEHEIHVFHIVREALSNIAQHSSASHARLIVDHLCGYYVFAVEDNGVGTFSQVEGHYGIIIMRERAQRIGGEIRVESAKGLGTCVQLFFPEPGTNWRMLHD